MDAALTLAGLGEDALVRRLVRLLPVSGETVEKGPGDDCAIVAGTVPGEWSLLKADAVVEGVHFVSGEKMARVGWKALCRAISDVAAMGGVPLHALVSVTAPPSTPWTELRDLYRGIARAARAHGVAVVGGETTHSAGPLVCSVFLTGRVERECCVRRSGGRPGDVLLVTGRLGGSFASGRHLDFKPRVAEARWLVTHFRPRAMMDLSDGLAKDGPRLAAASGCGLELVPQAVPRRRGSSLEAACAEGEDFELLLAVCPSQAEDLQTGWKRVFPRLPLTRIGRLLPAGKGLRPRAIFNLRGYDHFQQP
jgi:thiamine-monophosphate kinase